jgi:hypothetical protein
LREPAFADFRVKDCLQLFSGGGIGKNNSGKFVAAQLAVRRDKIFSELTLNLRQRGFAGLDELAREFVAVQNLRAAGAKKTGGGGFAHPHATGQTANFHWLKITNYGKVLVR